jgi:hypothetical protein
MGAGEEAVEILSTRVSSSQRLAAGDGLIREMSFSMRVGALVASLRPIPEIHGRPLRPVADAREKLP